MSKSIKIIIVFYFMFGALVFARDRRTAEATIGNHHQVFRKIGIGESDQPSLIMLSWIGTGKLGVYTISNTGQNGYFEPPVGWRYYTGQWPSGFTSGNGRTGEYPRGTNQFYTWAAGLWIGGIVQVQINDTLFIEEPRVATGAYYSDQGALSDLYQSNQRIPSGQDGEADFLFKQNGVTDLKDYQSLWSYADTSINASRRALGFEELVIRPENGDYISDEDTYCVWGDYWPEEEAATIFTTKYDTDPLGVRVEQRTYSWNTDSYIYLNYRITNMNSFPIKDVYFGYFMDNDVGDASDDLIGYDEALNLGYSYDSDFQESGWKALAGYIGTTFLKTPPDSNGQALGLTGFQTWTIDGDEADVDNEGRDDLKYAQLAKGGYEVYTIPQDVRQLTASGPYKTLEPGETVEVTIAVIAGGSLAEVRKNTISAQDRYDKAYIGPAPPPSPNLTLEPADHRVILNWDKFSETVKDPASQLIDFEGYRVYRSDDGGLTWGTETSDDERYPKGYIPIAEYDIAGDETGRFVSVGYSVGASSSSISFKGFTSQAADYFIEAEYTIQFLPGKQLLVYNLSQEKAYTFNKTALADGLGFAIVDDQTLAAFNDAIYRSGEYITFDGLLVSIADGLDNDGNNSPPAVGDVFKVQTFESQEIGEQVGLDYVIVDNDLTNGVSYTYSVTAFDKGDPTADLPSLESSLFTNSTTVIPRGTPVDKTVEELSSVERVAGGSAGAISVEIHNPLEMITADFDIEFFGSDTLTNLAQFMRIVNTTTDTVVIDSVQLVSGRAAVSVYGLDLIASGPAVASVDPENFGWEEGKESSYTFSTIGGTPQPFDYTIEFVDSITASPFNGDPVILPNGILSPWHITNLTKGNTPKSYSFPLISTGFKNGGIIRVMREKYKNTNDFAFGLQLSTADATDPIVPGDVLTVKTIKPFLSTDRFTFSTQGLHELKDKGTYKLSEIRVVPNPYYVRAQWDTDRFTKHVKFTHLPEVCQIRIFTTSGILIKTIDHDENSGDPSGYHEWNLRNSEELDIASGLYIFQVKDQNSGDEKVGKFAVIL